MKTLVWLSLIVVAACGLSGSNSPSDVAVLQTQNVIATSDLLKSVAKEFYRTHSDHYDMLVIWGAAEFAPGTSFYLPVRNDVTGLGYHHVGDDLFDTSADYGSSVLQGIVWVGPNWITNTDTSEGPRSNLGILAQETAHRWAATVYYRDADTNADSSALLEDAYHWNFYLNTGASPMGGNEWEDLGNSVYRAKPIERVEFCPLDLYLMGLIPPEDVGTIGLLESPRTQSALSAATKSIASAKTSEEITVEANYKAIDIDQIIMAEGNRGPDTAFNAASIRQAWIYLYKAPSLITYSDLNTIENLRVQWYDFFYQATGGKSEIDTVLH